jgi:thiol-disulfide isomerase/thioredoxin
MLIGLLLGGGFAFIVFWGFPSASEPGAISTGIENTTLQPGAVVPVSGENAASGVAVDAVAPDFVLEDISGEEYQLSDLRGQVVLLNFWATWCGPCLVEMPLLESDYQAYKNEGFIVLAVNDGESLQKVEQFGNENDLNIPLLLDPGRVVQRLYEIRGYPSSVFVDQDGRIKFIHIGLIQESQLTNYMEELGFSS